ncbi:methyltransferase domain-containing protein [Candidatus Woesearchaeota archaeon]|jgi:tellurite methyltransferase|nr:methyltransferase domain-containing protein [Candidatus Woesearchaeota archaeon]
MNTNEIIKTCLKDLEPKNVLDLGIGKGRCSKIFLKKGVEIIGVDLKDYKIPGIKFVKSNIKNFDFKENFDLIIASLVLHFLNKDLSLEIIKKIKTFTNKNGHNFILTMNKRDNLFKKNKNNFYFDEEELKELYKDWEIIKSGNFETDLEEHDNLKPHKHNLSFILTKKAY